LKRGCCWVIGDGSRKSVTGNHRFEGKEGGG
jgi:hypothetical protein